MTYPVPAASTDLKGKVGDGEMAVVMDNCARSGSDPFQQVLGRDLQLLIRQSDVDFAACDPDDHASWADFFRSKTRGKHGHPCRDYDHERKEPATGSEHPQLPPRVALTNEDSRSLLLLREVCHIGE